MYEFKESDWKLFRERIPDWQENFMARLCGEYVELLRSDAMPSTRFWQLEKRIRQDMRKAGVQAERSRSKMMTVIDRLLLEGAITPDDLEGFSDGLRETLAPPRGRPGPAAGDGGQG